MRPPVAQLDAIRAEQGSEAEAPVDGGPGDRRPLAVVLAENKEAKEAAFQEQWKQMKTGALHAGADSTEPCSEWLAPLSWQGRISVAILGCALKIATLGGKRCNGVLYRLCGG